MAKEIITIRRRRIRNVNDAQMVYAYSVLQLSLQQLGEMLGVHPTTIMYRLQKHKIPTRPQGQRVNMSNKEKQLAICWLVNNTGVTQRRVATAFQLSQPWVCQVAARA